VAGGESCGCAPPPRPPPRFPSPATSPLSPLCSQAAREGLQGGQFETLLKTLADENAKLRAELSRMKGELTQALLGRTKLPCGLRYMPAPTADEEPEEAPDE
jgi:hypothetical protein